MFKQRRALLLATVGGITSCDRRQLFELTIFEEVKLADGAIILVETEVQFQSAALFSKYESAIRRVTSLTFDAGPPVGRFRLTTWLHPVFLDRIDAKWYVVVVGQGPFGKTDESHLLWGQSFTTRIQRIAVFEGSAFRAISWQEAPAQIQRENLFPLVETEYLAKLDKQRVSLAQKEILLSNERLDPDRRQITRPLNF